MGCQRDLADQDKNLVFNSDHVKEIIADGAKNVFDIWYAWDKDKYKDDPIFKELLDYVKDNNTNI